MLPVEKLVHVAGTVLDHEDAMLYVWFDEGNVGFKSLEIILILADLPGKIGRFKPNCGDCFYFDHVLICLDCSSSYFEPYYLFGAFQRAYFPSLPSLASVWKASQLLRRPQDGFLLPGQWS